MDKKLIIAFVIVLFAVVGGYFIFMNWGSQPLVTSLQGKVMDSSGKPIQGVTISAGGKTTFTGTDGSWVLTIDKGNYNVKATKVGYENKTSIVAAIEAKTYTIDFTLAAVQVKPKQATLNGKITDKEGKPLIATVSIEGKLAPVATDGSWSAVVDLGTYNVKVAKDGYDPASTSISATEEKIYVVNFTLNPTAPKTITLKFLTRHGSDITYNAKIAFLASDIAKKYNIVDLKFIGISGNLWVDTIKRSGDIDIAWGGGPVLFDTVMNEGLLAPLKGANIVTVLAQLPPEIGGMPLKRIKNGETLWAGAAISSFGFTINKQYLSREKLPEPGSWADIANETYAITLPNPSIGTADALLSTSNTRIFEIILQRYGWIAGWKLLTRMGANSLIFDKSELVRDAAITGSIGVGTTIDFYGYTAQLENPELCKYILPSDGTIINPDPIALVTMSPNAEAATAFIAWHLSAEGQKVWLIDTINRMPANPAVFETPEGLKRLDLKEIYEKTKKTITIDFSDPLALSYENSLMYYYNAAIVRPQFKLTDTWMKITQAYHNGKITRIQFLGFVEKLGNPTTLEFIDPANGTKQTFTEEFAKSINDKISIDSTYRTKLVDAILKATEAKYDAIAAELKGITG